MSLVARTPWLVVRLVAGLPMARIDWGLFDLVSVIKYRHRRRWRHQVILPYNRLFASRTLASRIFPGCRSRKLGFRPGGGSGFGSRQRIGTGGGSGARRKKHRRFVGSSHPGKGRRRECSARFLCNCFLSLSSFLCGRGCGSCRGCLGESRTGAQAQAVISEPYADVDRDKEGIDRRMHLDGYESFDQI